MDYAGTQRLHTTFETSSARRLLLKLSRGKRPRKEYSDSRWIYPIEVLCKSDRQFWEDLASQVCHVVVTCILTSFKLRSIADIHRSACVKMNSPQPKYKPTRRLVEIFNATIASTVSKNKDRIHVVEQKLQGLSSPLALAISLGG